MKIPLKLTVFLWAGLAVFASLQTPEPAFSHGGRIELVDFQFDQHFKPGETVTLNASVRNNTGITLPVYLDFVITNTATGVSREVFTSASSITGGRTVPFSTTTSFTAADSGTHSVSVLAIETGAVDITRDRHFAPVPIHIGTPTQEISVFPNVFNFGTIAPGRQMHPQPIKVTYDFFLFNRLRMDQPFFIRIYTDNASRFKGIPGSLHSLSPAGLVSADGRYSIPIRAWCLNYGPNFEETGWNANLMGPPPVEHDIHWIGPILNDGEHDEARSAWLRIPDITEMTANPSSWRDLVGQDPFDSGAVTDNNQTGDGRLDSPFEVYLATSAGPTAVRGEYHARIVIELFTP